MPSDEVLREGERVMTVCNACRYCEGYCPVFPAMEQRLAVRARRPDLPRQSVPQLRRVPVRLPVRAAARVRRSTCRRRWPQIRLRSYEEYCWPKALGRRVQASRRRDDARCRSRLLDGVLFAAPALAAGDRRGSGPPMPDGDFYGVVPHGVMVAVFGAVALFVVARARHRRRAILARRHRRPTGMADRRSAVVTALRDALTLTPPARRRRRLHDRGRATRSPWRRWFHHCTFYGFLLCFASTTVAAIYHTSSGWPAPYAYTSLPVVLGTVGGVGLLIGPAGLLALRRRRDPALGDPAQQGSTARSSCCCC